MEAMKTKGGKRLGAGRKPVLNKKKQVSLYVEGVKMLKFGGEEKMKEYLYGVIDNFGNDATTPPTAPKIEENAASRTEVPKQIKEPEIALKLPITGLPPKLSAYDGFVAELNKATTIAQVEEIMKRSKGEIMFPREKIALENHAKEVSKEMFND